MLNYTPLTVSFLSDRTKIAAPGFAGGQDGGLGSVTLNGQPINPKQTTIVQPGDLLVLSTPGGAGYDDPQQRDPWRVQDDVTAGVVSATRARTDYGWNAPSEVEKGC